MQTFNANRILNEKETQQRKIKLDSVPQRLIVTLSSRCNLDCIMCEVKKTGWDIPHKIIQEAIGLLPYLESVIWQGGEPFLLEYFEDIFEQASKFVNLKQMIVTNGLLITEAWAEKLVKNNVELTFSIDGITKETYEHIRNGAKFDDVIRSLKIIRNARSKYNSQRMSMRLHVVVMKSNYHQLDGFIDFAREYGFDAIHLISMWGSRGSQEDIFCHQEKEPLNYISSIRNKLEEKAKRYNIKLLNALPCGKDNPNNGSCHTENSSTANGLSCNVPWQQLNIDPGGGVRPGCLCLKTVGSVLENSLSELWNNELMQLYRGKIIEKNFDPICNLTCLSVQISEQLKKCKSC